MELYLKSWQSAPDLFYAGLATSINPFLNPLVPIPCPCARLWESYCGLEFAAYLPLEDQTLG